MDVTKILGELRQEREQIEEAIISLERLAGGADGVAAGRPPGCRWQETWPAAGEQEQNTGLAKTAVG